MQPLPISRFFLSRDWLELLAAHGMPGNIERRTVSLGNGQLALVMKKRNALALSNFYSPTVGFVDGYVPGEHEIRMLGGALRALRAASLYLAPLREDTPWIESVMEHLRSDGFHVDTLRVSTNWYLPCEGLSWHEYLASRPSRLRNTLQRCRKKLQAAKLRVEIFQSEGPGLDEALAAYQHIYAASWKEPEPFPDFMPALCRMAAHQGCLRLGVLYVGDEPAAAQVWFVKDACASIYKLAYDARFAKSGVGTVLTAALTEHVLDVDTVSEIDFLTGDDAYKAEWMTHSRALIGLIAFDKRAFSGQLQAARHFGGKYLRKLKARARDKQ